MSIEGIHIVSFDVPYPADYGGVIDVYNRCRFLKKNGVSVILHCFEYGRGRPKELEKIADEVCYYPRKRSVKSLFSSLPFIVKTRNDSRLLERLKEDDFPILFEGIHTCFYLGHPDLSERWKGVRAHNIEHDYYQELSKIDKHPLKRLFFRKEAQKLSRFEATFQHANDILSVTPKDNQYFKKTYNKGQYIPVFNPLDWGKKEREVKNHALFHGNLSVQENEHAIRFLVDYVWEKNFPLSLKIAGKQPSSSFMNYLKRLNFPVECIPNPDDITLNQLIREAKINLLPTFQNTGIKHKLLNCLSNGGFCLANDDMVNGTGLDEFCVIANTVKEWKDSIRALAQEKEDEEALLNRKSVIRERFDCDKNAQKIIDLIVRN